MMKLGKKRTPEMSIDKDFVFHREVAGFVVPGHGIISMSTDNMGGGVAFDFFDIWHKIKNIDYDIGIMIHSHPPGHNRMSSIDSNMVYGWVQALGCPVLFVITTWFEDVAYLCKRNKDDHNKIDRDIIEFFPNTTLKHIVSEICVMSFFEDDFTENECQLVVESLNSFPSKPNSLLGKIIEAHCHA